MLILHEGLGVWEGGGGVILNIYMNITCSVIFGG